MALQHGNLRAQSEWQTFFVNIGISEDRSTTYATRFVEQEMTEAELSSFTKEILKETTT